MPRFQGKGFLDGIQFFHAPAERLQAAGQIGPDGGLIGICAGRAAKQQLRLVGCAAREHAHSQFIEHRGVLRSPLRHIGQQLVRLRNTARGLFRL